MRGHRALESGCVCVATSLVRYSGCRSSLVCVDPSHWYGALPGARTTRAQGHLLPYPFDRKISSSVPRAVANTRDTSHIKSNGDGNSGGHTAHSASNLSGCVQCRCNHVRRALRTPGNAHDNIFSPGNCSNGVAHTKNTSLPALSTARPITTHTSRGNTCCGMGGVIDGCTKGKSHESAHYYNIRCRRGHHMR